MEGSHTDMARCSIGCFRDAIGEFYHWINEPRTKHFPGCIDRKTAYMSEYFWDRSLSCSPCPSDEVWEASTEKLMTILCQTR